MASSIPTQSADLVSYLRKIPLHHLQTGLAQLLESINYFTSKLPPPILNAAASVGIRLSPQLVLALLFTLLNFLFTFVKTRMSSRWYTSYGAPRSPFQASDPRIPPIVTDDDYHYMTADDIVDPPASTYDRRSPPGYNYSSSRANHGSFQDDGPDIIILKYKARTYPLHFQAYSIGEDLLKVSDLRSKAAIETGCGRDTRRITLLYKGRKLRDDYKTCREEGLKQNSEIVCVISEPGSRDDSSDSADESDMINELGAGAAPGGGVRIDVDGSIIEPAKSRTKRKTRRRSKNGSRMKSPSRNSTAPSIKPNDYPSRGTRSSPPLRSTRTSPPQPTQTKSPPSRQQRSPSPPAANVNPDTPLGKIITIKKTMRAEYFPACDAFLDSPPADPKVREFEYKRLEETLLTNVIMKLDSVETEGDDTARTKRKALVQECQAMLNDLDKHKGGSGRR